MWAKFIIVVGLVTGFVGTGNFAMAQASPAEVEAEVRDVFADTPVMIDVARCESKFRQFTDAGNVLRGGYGGQMIGVFQFYESVHGDAAADLGHDLSTLEGNIAYAQHLYDTSGTTPWESSQACWETSTATATIIAADESSTASATAPMTETEMREKIALLQQLVSLLQTLLDLKMA